MWKQQVIDKRKKLVVRFIRYALILMIVIGILAAFAGLRELKKILWELRFLPVIEAFISALTVYCMEGILLSLALGILGERLKPLNALHSSFIINTLGYTVSFGGITPFATQMYVLDYQGISFGKAALSRAFQVFFFNILFSVLLASGYVLVLLQSRYMDINITAITVAVVFFFSVILLLYLELFWRSFREKGIRFFFNVVNRILKIVKKKLPMEKEQVTNFIEDFIGKLSDLRKKPGRFAALIAVTTVDWAFWLLVMFFSFKAVHYSIPVGMLITGFSIGQIVALISMLPGGIGMLEGSMALTFVGLGVPLHTALAAILLYRMTFNIVPFLLSLPLYFILKRRQPEEKPAPGRG